MQSRQSAARLNAPLLRPGLLKRPRLVHIRVLLARNRLAEAEGLLAEAEAAARAGKRHYHLVTIHILRAVASQRLGRGDDAAAYLARALRLAAPEGMYRQFVDDVSAMQEVLRAARPAAPAFVDDLLNRLSAADGRTPAAKVKVTGVERDMPGEPLSRRELEILALIAEGLSNRDIAQELHITPGTVKWHVNRILAKLGANSRTQALARAGRLKLL